MASKKHQKSQPGAARGPARIERLVVKNYRALKSVELKDITPLTVLLGPNGSGKSTVFDVFSFLSDCFRMGLRPAWDRRGRAKELRTHGQEGPVTFEFTYRDELGRLMTYHLAVNEAHGRVFVGNEWLRWERGVRLIRSRGRVRELLVLRRSGRRRPAPCLGTTCGWAVG